jgi:hypothetical protein
MCLVHAWRMAGEMVHALAVSMRTRWPGLDALSLSMEGGRVLTGAVARQRGDEKMDGATVIQW